MGKSIDCLLIGYNEMDFAAYEKSIRKMGENSGAYRDLNLNFLEDSGKFYTFADAFNWRYCLDKPGDKGPGRPWKPFKIGETFNPAIAYLGSYLHRKNITFDYVNAFREEKDRLAGKLQEEEILTIAITTTLYISVLPIADIIEFIKNHNQRAKIIVGGPFVATQLANADPDTVSYLFEHVIGADVYVNSSQGEATLVKIIDALKNNLPLAGVPNIYYKTRDGYESTPILKENNLLVHNPVNWSLFSRRVGKYVNIRTAISCPFSCAFCGFPQHAGKYQTTGVEFIEAELDQIERLGSVTRISFIDDTFNVPRQRFKDILERMIKKRYPFRWICNTRCQFIDRESVALMKESGCDGVFLGIESGNNQVLKNMNKAADVEAYLEGITLLKQYGIKTFGSFIIGFPGETSKTVRDTLRFIEESGLDFYRAQLWYYEKITPIRQERNKYHISGSNFEWSHATMDARTASEWVHEIFLSVENSTWIPQYNFDFENLMHLVDRGLSMDETRNLLDLFNRAIKEKLLNPLQKKRSFDTFRRADG
jgi:anaerobic magnesium-protoporphyrin IX monomethyl ester cyclase